MSRTTTVEASVNLTLQDRLTQRLNRVTQRLNRLGRAAGLDRLTASTKNLGRGLGRLGGSLGTATARLGGLTAAIGLGGGGAVAAMAGLTRQTAESADRIAKTSRQLGLTAEAYQEIGYAAEMSGVSMGTLDTSLQSMNRRMAEAAGGNKSFAKYYDQLGVSLTDTSGNLRDSEAVFTDVVAAMQSIESPAERAALAMGLFGRSGMDMTKLIEAGPDGLRRLREEFAKTGYVLSTTESEFGESYLDNIARLQVRLEGLRRQVGAKLMPVLDQFVRRLTGWIDANRELISDRITSWVQRLGQFLTDLMDPTSQIRQGIAGFAESLSGLANFMMPAIKAIGAGKVALAGLAVVILGPVIGALAGLSETRRAEIDLPIRPHSARNPRRPLTGKIWQRFCQPRRSMVIPEAY